MSATFQNLREFYIQYFAKHTRRFGVSLMLSIVQALLLIPIPFLVHALFKTLSTHGEVRSLFLILGSIICLIIGAAAAAIINRRITLSLIKESVGDLRAHLVEQTLVRSRAEYATLEVDAIHSDIVYGTERIDCMMSALFTQVVPGILVGLGIGIVLLHLSPLLTFVVVLSLPILYVCARAFGRHVQVLVKKFHADFSTFSERISFVTHFHELIKISGSERFELSQQRRSIQDLRFSSSTMAFFSTIHTIMQGNVMVLVGVIVLLVGGIQIISGTMTLGVVLSFYIALSVLISHMRVAVGALPTVLEGWESLHALSVHLGWTPTLSSGGRNINSITRIDMEDVSFGYGDERMLQGVSLTLTHGEMIGLYGPSGSGKSTLASLLSGLYQPQSGRVSFNGVDIKEIDPESYRSRIGMLTQGLLIFSGSIRDNLTYGIANVSDDLLREVCTMCGIQEYIDALPEGYDTPVGANGTQLSGGQRQRVALARALVRQPDILILDEPDNNLDQMMIESILTHIRQKKITTLVITHNRLLAQHFDRFYECVKVGGVTLVREQKI